MSYPESVDICEVGPRDGFQFEEKLIPTELKVEIIRELARAGVKRIQATSFVHPKWVPQMADAEDVISALADVEGTTLSALVLNLRGLDRARASGIRHVDVSIATNDRHSLDNTNMSAADALAQGEAMVEEAVAHGMLPQIGFQTVFGYETPGDTPVETVVEMASRFAAAGVESISLADSTGMANPTSIRTTVEAVKGVSGRVPIVLHLHDTRGLGMANIVAALECGVNRFDAALGGMGGCPFIPGATGNVATEDTVYLLDSLGVRSGIDMSAVAACSARLSAFLGKSFPGKLYSLQGKHTRRVQADA
ncbi:MAG: hydroxymethylglutaryl-CoA lyase [Rhodothermales bacterium]|nr:hydroxymethylglutaryl-CoA lyase [Rhodothermales bacterium]